MGDIAIEKVERGSELAEELLRFVEQCSWIEARDHIAQMIREWVFTDWESMFVATMDGKIVGMASVMKTDYYPLPDIRPWVSCVFVSEAYRGQRISGKMIAHANQYLKQHQDCFEFLLRAEYVEEHLPDTNLLNEKRNYHST